MSERGAYIFGCQGTRLDEEERRFFRDARPFGFILFTRNLGSADEIRRLAGDLRASVGESVPVLIDQEGGRVQRLRGSGWRDWLPPLEQCERLPGDSVERALWLRYALIALELRNVGIDVNCVPCADIAMPQTHRFLFNRCYGREPAAVARRARIVAEACLEMSVLPVLKHMPGHGRCSADSHLELPSTAARKEELLASDFKPFRELRDLPMAMTAHVLFKALDSDYPATQSKAVIRCIRDEIGFDGLLMTDDLSMSALRGGSISERCRLSLAAGCDVILHCNGELAEMQSVASEAQSLEGVAALRAQRVLDVRRDSVEINAELLVEEFESAMARAA